MQERRQTKQNEKQDVQISRAMSRLTNLNNENNFETVRASGVQMRSPLKRDMSFCRDDNQEVIMEEPVQMAGKRTFAEHQDP